VVGRHPLLDLGQAVVGKPRHPGFHPVVDVALAEAECAAHFPARQLPPGGQAGDVLDAHAQVPRHLRNIHDFIRHGGILAISWRYTRRAWRRRMTPILTTAIDFGPART
jgi:hypothetical protein